MIDPWDGVIAKVLPIQGNIPQALRVLPSLLVLPERGGRGEARFMVVCEANLSSLEVIPQGKDNPIEVREIGREDSPSRFDFVASLRPEVPVRHGAHDLLIRPTSGGRSAVRIPVHIRKEPTLDDEG